MKMKKGSSFSHNASFAAFSSFTYVMTVTVFRAGLKLILNVQQYEYIYELTESAGVRVLVHERSQMPFPEQEGINIGTNTWAELAVREVKHTTHYITCVLQL
jgi:hypothetical protein